MTRDYSNLLNRLTDGCAAHTVRTPKLVRDVTDTLGRLTILSSSEALLEWIDGSTAVGVDRATRNWATRHPDAVWTIDLSVERAGGTLTPFCPPRVLTFDAHIPIRVAASLSGRFAASNLAQAADLAAVGTVKVCRGLAVGFIGQQSLAVEDDNAAKRLSWWMPDGRALELQVIVDANGESALELLDILSAQQAFRAQCGPNVLLQFGPHSELPFDLQGLHAMVPAATVQILMATRSELFEAWGLYAKVQRDEMAERERRRAEHPLTFAKGSAEGKRWRAQASMSEEAIDAWVGSDLNYGRQAKVGQPVALKDGDLKLGAFTLTNATVRGPGLVDLYLESQAGTFSLPATGRLEAEEDKGSKRQEEREREALEQLTRGLASCELLPLLLTSPGEATPPTIAARLALVPMEKLDDDQQLAVKMILGCQDIVAIQGPPGTGKTRVIAEALQQIGATRRPEGGVARVLISSVQNEAVLNVVDRLAGMDGVVFHVLQRKGRDQDEEIVLTSSRLTQGSVIVAALEKRLVVGEIERKLDALHVQEEAVEHLRTMLAAGESAHCRAANLLDVEAARGVSLLGRRLQVQAIDIASRLRAVAQPESPEPPQPLRGLPAEPGKALEWWAEVEGAWPDTSRAAVASAVANVADAIKRPPVAREILLKRGWPALQKVVAASIESQPAEARTSGTSPPANTASENALEWVRAALEFVAARRREVLNDPDAIAVQFLHALRQDAGAWQSIVSRHGNAVAATCSMSAKAKLNPGEFYDWVIIDEAGRASPFELLIPMVQGKRIVLIGDHRQLPPTVDEFLANRATDGKFDTSELVANTLFSSLFKLLPEACCTRLSTQYRMHGEIGELVNNLFYKPNGEPVESHFRGARGANRTSALGVFENRPLVWQEVPRVGPPCGEENRAQADRVVAILRDYAAAGAKPDHIAIICPYGRQRALYDKLLGGEPHLKAICQVKTIDAVQGREYPVVILDLVRNDGRPGFLASPNRLNVAISRAQRQLVVVGAANQWLTSTMSARAPALAQLVRTLSDLEKSNR